LPDPFFFRNGKKCIGWGSNNRRFVAAGVERIATFDRVGNLFRSAEGTTSENVITVLIELPPDVVEVGTVFANGGLGSGDSSKTDECACLRQNDRGRTGSVVNPRGGYPRTTHAEGITESKTMGIKAGDRGGRQLVGSR